MIRSTQTLILLVLATLTGAGCVRSNPRFDREEESVRVKTRATVFSEPGSARIYVNGQYVGETPDDGTPLDVDLIYRYVNKVYVREKSYVAYRKTTETKLKEYRNNEFEIEARKTGYVTVKKSIILKGEHDSEIHLPLRAVPSETDSTHDETR